MLVSLTKENIMSRMKEQWQDEQERLEQEERQNPQLMDYYFNYHQHDIDQQTIDFIDKAEYDAWCEYHKLGNNWHHEYVNK